MSVTFFILLSIFFRSLWFSNLIQISRLSMSSPLCCLICESIIIISQWSLEVSPINWIILIVHMIGGDPQWPPLWLKIIDLQYHLNCSDDWGRPPMPPSWLKIIDLQYHCNYPYNWGRPPMTPLMIKDIWFAISF